MTYIAPTLSDFRVRFPEFAPVGDALVQMVLEEAIPQVGETWEERDRKPAALYLAAHMLAMEGEPARSKGITDGAPLAPGPMISRKVGDVSTTYASTSDRLGGLAVDADGYMLTSYGTQYLVYMRRNFSTFAVF